MEEHTALAVREQTFDAGQLDVIRKTLMPQGNTEAEFQLAIEICAQTGLNPFKREIYFAKPGGKFAAITGIDGYRRIAERDEMYDGMEGPFYSDDGVNWSEAPPSARPAFAKVAIHRKDRKVPFTKVVSMAEFYRQPAPNKGPGPWQTYPAHMLGIVAERHAMREAFATKTENLTFAEDYTPAGVSEVTVEDIPISRPRLRQLHMLARQLGMSDAERHEAAGVKSFLDLREHEAQRLVDEWTMMATPDASERAAVQGRRAVAELMGGPDPAPAPHPPSQDERPPAATLLNDYPVSDGGAADEATEAGSTVAPPSEPFDPDAPSPEYIEGVDEVEDEAVNPGGDPGPDGDVGGEADAAEVPVQEPARSPSQVATQRDRAIALYGGGTSGRNKLRLAWKAQHKDVNPPLVEDMTSADLEALIAAKVKG